MIGLRKSPEVPLAWQCKNRCPKRRQIESEERVCDRCCSPNGSDHRWVLFIQGYYLRHPGPDLIICDEAHCMWEDISTSVVPWKWRFDCRKNLDTSISCTLNHIRTRRRILLTGTPMQNNLREYYAMVQFCSPSYLGEIMVAQKIISSSPFRHWRNIQMEILFDYWVRSPSW